MIATLAFIATCAGVHAVTSANNKQTYEPVSRVQGLRDKYRADARTAALACDAAGIQVPIQTMTMRKEDAQ